MLFPIQQLLKGRDAPLCVPRETRIDKALAQMIEHDYSQLPVVDDQGDLVGMVSKDSIVGSYYHIGQSVSLLGLTVDHCQTKPMTMTAEQDIFDALDLLKTHFAVIIVEGQKPVGILTNYDTTHFFRDISEGLILVEDIETTLRQYVETILSDEHSMATALKHAFGAQKNDPDEPAVSFDRLTFGQQMRFIKHPANWPHFEGIFQPLDLFWPLMDQVREIRNQLAHFRGRLEPMQHHALLYARDWLASRPKPVSPDVQVEKAHIGPLDIPEIRTGGRYAPLANWLAGLEPTSETIQIGFDDIQKLLGDELPPSAFSHRSWWANDRVTHVQSRTWLDAGWRVDAVDLSAQVVTFKRSNAVLMQLFFADLLERFKDAYPGITRAEKTQPVSWFNFSAGKTGFSFGWAFTGKKKLQVELYIDVEDKVKNKALFDRLAADKDEIEREYGAPLSWERLPDRRASRISVTHPATIADPPEKLEQAKQWALETTIKFVDVWRPRIKEL